MTQTDWQTRAETAEAANIRANALIGAQADENEKLVADLKTRLTKAINDCETQGMKAGRLEELVKEVIGWHSDSDSADYNECDTHPCAWCEAAERLLKDSGAA